MPGLVLVALETSASSSDAAEPPFLLVYDELAEGPHPLTEAPFEFLLGPSGRVPLPPSDCLECRGASCV